MHALLALGTLSAIFCFILTPLCRDLFLKFKLVDLPDNDRKLHRRPVPRIGGIPIALSYAMAIGLLAAFAPHGAGISVQHGQLLWSLLPATGFIFAIGLIDDIWGLKASHKLGGQIVAAVCAVSMGVQINVLGGHHIPSWLLFLVSVCWLIGCTNAFNLIDGMDGLASGVGLLATLTTLLAAILQGNWGLAMATVPLAGCLLAFLFYNFNPASVFLGDSGSLTIGFLLGCFSVIWSQKSATLLGMVAPLMALSLPLFEVALSIARRILRDQPIFQPDRGHIHHRLLGFGLDTRAAAFVLYGACGIAAILSLLQSSLSHHAGGFIILLFCVLSFLGIKRLGYIEFRTATQILRSNRILKMVQEEVSLETVRHSLSQAATARDYWKIARLACRKMGFSSVHLTLGNESFEEVFETLEADHTWRLSFALRAGQLSLARTAEAPPPPSLGAFLHIFKNSVDGKELLPEMTPLEHTVASRNEPTLQLAIEIEETPSDSRSADPSNPSTGATIREVKFYFLFRTWTWLRPGNVRS